MEEILIKHTQIEKEPLFEEIENGNTTKFVCHLDDKEAGSVSATLIGPGVYDIGGLFVDPSQRGQSISSSLVKVVNAFLERKKAKGILVNTIKGNAAMVYENNGWVKGEFKSQGAFGAYEYSYDGGKDNHS